MSLQVNRLTTNGADVRAAEGSCAGGGVKFRVKPSSLSTRSGARVTSWRCSPTLARVPHKPYFDFFDFFAITAVSATLSFCTSASSSGRESCRISIACCNCGVITSCCSSLSMSQFYFESHPYCPCFTSHDWSTVHYREFWTHEGRSSPWFDDPEFHLGRQDSRSAGGAISSTGIAWLRGPRPEWRHVLN